jgi:uncharacterized membrane protein
MSDKEQSHVIHPDQEQLGLERLVFFSDAVFAIAITLLALEIRLPVLDGGLTNAELTSSLLALWPKYLGYSISFLVIGFIWIGHHRKFRFITHFDSNLLLLNLLLLMVIAFIPFPASVISEYGNRTATIFYALVMILAGLLSAIIWIYSSFQNRLIDPTVDLRYRRKETWGPLLMSVIFLISIGIAYLNDDLAKASWGLIIFIYLLSDKGIRFWNFDRKSRREV